MARRRIGFINTHPIQYSAPFYRAINRTTDLEAVPIYLSDSSLRGSVDRQFGQAVKWDVDLLGGTDALFVPGYQKRPINAWSWRLIAPGIWKVVRDARLDALVVHGHSTPANFIALAAAKRQGIPVFMRTETHLLLRRGQAKRALRQRLLPCIYAPFDGFLAIGSRNHGFYRSLGIAEAAIHLVPYTVDNDRFAHASALTSGARKALRAELGLREDVPAIVYASKLTLRKHPDHLLAAAKLLRASGLDFDLLFVGSGEMEASLRQQAADLPGAAPIFRGFVNQSALPAILGASDLFVLPAEDEAFGLVINEAMCAGLPIVAADEIGAVPDLVHQDRNGRLFKAGDVTGLADALRPLVADPALTKRMGDESRKIIAGWSYEAGIAGLRAALDASR